MNDFKDKNMNIKLSTDRRWNEVTVTFDKNTKHP